MVLTLVVALYGISLGAIELHVILNESIFDIFFVGCLLGSPYLLCVAKIMDIVGRLTVNRNALSKYIIYIIAAILLVIWIVAFDFIRN